MANPEKVCPIVVRNRDSHVEVLAFLHPKAGKQFVKGTIKEGEKPKRAAERELWEESGVVAASLEHLGDCRIASKNERWHFFCCLTSRLPESWSYETEDDYGHTFEFFWHSVHRRLDSEWHPMFHEAFEYFVPRLISE